MQHSQTETPLIAALKTCLRADNAPFYTPGHKRGQGAPAALRDLLGAPVFRADLPELPELDNLFAPQGAIQAAQELAAAAFGADQTWFLVNGSTCGVMAAILATCEPGDKIILPRNCHQSAIAGLILSGAVPLFVQPDYDPALNIAHSITPTAIAAMLAQHPDAVAVMLVYPTYYGVCGDIVAIAQLCHQRNLPLLVDEAHGAHFAFHPSLPMSALAAGADLTVQSIHKTLSAMTQASMLHRQGNRIPLDRIRRALQLVQSTSPSYVLMASLDAARQQMATLGNPLMTRTLKLADQARSQISQISGLSVLRPEQANTPGFVSLDRTRLTVTVSDLGIDGFTADEILHQQFGVTAELPSLQHLTFIISLGNTEADIKRLVQALKRLAADLSGKEKLIILPSPLPPPVCLAPLTARQAFFAATETLPIAQTRDRISAELICPYPPGIPVLLPGERITAGALEHLQAVFAAGGIISGCTDPTLARLQVIKREQER